uniref:Integrase catalytic domain-containing protein n=1 Tax=Macrostomum lignano TaxID=282301 RepID=A0A1I8HW19_9PLAT
TVKRRIRSNAWNNCSAAERPYKAVRQQLSVENGVVCLRDLVVPPSRLRQDVLRAAHGDSHCGALATRNRLKLEAWWPGHCEDVENFVKQCQRCAEIRPMPARTCHTWPAEDGPWRRVHMDHAHVPGFGLLLIVVDAFSGWPEAVPVADKSATTVIKVLRLIFSRLGVPHTLVADNAPEFRDQQLHEWLKKIGCSPMHSPPYHPQSNGCAERMVQTVKKGLRAFAVHQGRFDAYLAKLLLNYRATPRGDGRGSPSALMGRQLRSPLTLQFDTDAPLVYQSRPGGPAETVRFVVQAGHNTAVVTRDKDDRPVLAHRDQLRLRPSPSRAEVTDNTDDSGRDPDDAGRSPDDGDRNPDEGGRNPDEGGRNPEPDSQRPDAAAPPQQAAEATPEPRRSCRSTKGTKKLAFARTALRLLLLTQRRQHHRLLHHRQLETSESVEPVSWSSHRTTIEFGSAGGVAATAAADAPTVPVPPAASSALFGEYWYSGAESINKSAASARPSSLKIPISAPMVPPGSLPHSSRILAVRLRSHSLPLSIFGTLCVMPSLTASRHQSLPRGSTGSNMLHRRWKDGVLRHDRCKSGPRVSWVSSCRLPKHRRLSRLSRTRPFSKFTITSDEEGALFRWAQDGHLVLHAGAGVLNCLLDQIDHILVDAEQQRQLLTRSSSSKADNLFERMHSTPASDSLEPWCHWNRSASLSTGEWELVLDLIFDFDLCAKIKGNQNSQQLIGLGASNHELNVVRREAASDSRLRDVVLRKKKAENTGAQPLRAEHDHIDAIGVAILQQTLGFRSPAARSLCVPTRTIRAMLFGLPQNPSGSLAGMRPMTKCTQNMTFWRINSKLSIRFNNIKCTQDVSPMKPHRERLAFLVKAVRLVLAFKLFPKETGDGIGPKTAYQRRLAGRAVAEYLELDAGQRALCWYQLLHADRSSFWTHLAEQACSQCVALGQSHHIGQDAVTAGQLGTRSGQQEATDKLQHERDGRLVALDSVLKWRPTDSILNVDAGAGLHQGADAVDTTDSCCRVQRSLRASVLRIQIGTAGAERACRHGDMDDGLAATIATVELHGWRQDEQLLLDPVGVAVLSGEEQAGQLKWLLIVVFIFRRGRLLLVLGAVVRESQNVNRGRHTAPDTDLKKEDFAQPGRRHGRRAQKRAAHLLRRHCQRAAADSAERDAAAPEVALPRQEDFDTRPVTSTDVVEFARRAPGGRAPGPDEVPVEALRITRVATEVARANIVGIPKKPGTTRKEEHRGISLMSCTAKLFIRVLLARLQPVLDSFLRYEQNGFRPRRGTVTQILALRRIIEEARIHQSSLIVIFVDFLKAFDSVARGALPHVLRAYNVPQQLISAIMALYQDTTAAVATPDGPSDLFSTTSGVLQGDTLAPFLFVLRTAFCCKGAPVDGTRRRNCLSLATRTTSPCCLRRPKAPNGCWTARVGLVINARKTEVLTVPHDLPAEIRLRDGDGPGTALPKCLQFVYLGGLVPDVGDDLARRRGKAWAAFRSVRAVLLSEALSDGARSQLFQAVVETALLYNAETWTLTGALEAQLDAAHAALVRAAFGARRGPGSETTESLYKRTGLTRPSALAESAAPAACRTCHPGRSLLPRAAAGRPACGPRRDRAGVARDDQPATSTAFLKCASTQPGGRKQKKKFSNPQHLLRGVLKHGELLPKPCVVRICFVSADGQDSEFVSQMIASCQSELAEYCRRRSFGPPLNLTLIDLSSGVGCSELDDHSLASVRRDELRRCLRQSRGPAICWATVGGPGNEEAEAFRAPPESVPQSVLDQLARVMNAGDEDRLRRWYQLDENAQPAQYCLLPVSSRHPEYLSADVRAAAAAAAAWRSEAAALLTSMRAAAAAIAGLGGLPTAWATGAAFEDADRDALESFDDSALLRCSTAEEFLFSARSRIEFAQQQAVQPVVPPLLIEAAAGHLRVRRRLLRMAAISCEDADQDGADFDKDFSSWRQARRAVMEYAASAGASTAPLLVVGPPGVGKSTLLADASTRLTMVAKDSTVVLFRLAGSDSELGCCGGIVRSLLRQLRGVYGDEGFAGEDEIKELSDSQLFSHLAACLGRLSSLHLLPHGHRLGIFVAGLDRLEGSLSSLAWLPAQLPSNVRIVSSCSAETASDWGCSCQSVLRLTDPTSKLEIERTAVRLLASGWRGRRLRAGQLAVALSSVLGNEVESSCRCGVALRLRLAMAGASAWRSDFKVGRSELEDGSCPVRRLMERALERLERRFGSRPVGEALAAVTYLTEVGAWS